MGLAAYPANAPSDIAVTLPCDARGVTTGCCRKIRNFGSLIDPAPATVQDSLGLPSNRGIAKVYSPQVSLLPEIFCLLELIKISFILINFIVIYSNCELAQL